MYKRLLLLSALVLAASVGLTCLGYHALAQWSRGLEGTRLGEFAEVAEQIRQDVRRQLDEFVRTEQQRPYTDYLYNYVPDNLVGDESSLPLLRSPLAGQFRNGLAYGYFQVGPDREIITPYDADKRSGQADADVLTAQVRKHLENLTSNLLPVIEARHEVPAHPTGLPTSPLGDQELSKQTLGGPEVALDNKSPARQAAGARSKAYAIESLQQQSQMPQILTQDRSVAASHQSVVERPRPSAAPASTQRKATRDSNNATVPIRIEPFVPLVVPGPGREPSLFGGQVFLRRRVPIEDRRLLPGFPWDERQLVTDVQESAGRLIREGRAFAWPPMGGGESGPGGAQDLPAYTAILDFGLGTLTLALREANPGWIAQRLRTRRHVYLGITTVVARAVGLALVRLWRATRAQIALVQKKDEFLSAVSHERRPPLTSMRR